MEKIFAAFTIFTFLLFAVSAARISLDPSAIDLPVVQSSDDASKTTKSSPGSAAAVDSNIILPSEMTKSESDGNDGVSEPDKARMFRVDLTPRPDFARFHTINRHFFDEPRIPLRFVNRRPYRHFVNPFMIPRSEISYGNDVILSGETSNVDSETFHRQAPLKRLKVKHDYGHHHHRHHRHHRHQDNNDGSRPKHMFDREKLKSLVRQHKEKKREYEAGLMRRIRKFLKHTFD